MTDLDVRFVEDPGYLVVSAAGPSSREKAMRLLEDIAAEAKHKGVQRVLIDAVDVTGDMPDLDRYDFGKRAAELLGHVERLAILRGPGFRYTGFFFDVAQNRGLQTRAFAVREEAIAWLIGS